jgi:hypothetical protein
LQLLAQTLPYIVSASFALRQANASGVEKLIHLRNAIAELRDFGLVPSFGLRKAIPNFLNLALILSALFFVVEAKLAELAFEMLGALFFVLEVELEELALEMLNPRNPFWNGSIQAAHCSGKKIGFSPVRGSRSVR